VLKGLMLLTSVVVARGLGDQAMGLFAVGYSVALIGTNVLAFGQVEVLIRETSHSPDRLPEFLRAAETIQYWALSFLLLLAVPFGAFMTSGPLQWALLAFLPYTVVRSRLIVNAAVFKGLDRMDVEVKARAIELGMTMLVLVALVSCGAPAWIPGLAFSIGGLAALVWIQRHLRPWRSQSGGGIQNELRYFLAEGLPFLGLGLFSQLFQRSGSVLLAILGVVAVSIGHYGAADTLVIGALTVPSILATAIYPTLSRMEEHGSSRVRLTSLVLGIAVVIGLLLSFPMAMLSNMLMRIVFGKSFVGAAPVLARLAWSLPGTCVMVLLGTLLAARCEQSRTFWVHVVFVGVLLALGFLWIPREGVMGAASALVMARSGGAVVLAVAAFWRPALDGGDRALV